MRTSAQKQCQHGACPRMCATRAQKERNAAIHAGVLGLPLLLVQNALADVPSLEGLSYESAIAPKAAVKVATKASESAAQLDSVSGQDLTPLLAGLAVGLAIAGGAIAYFAKPSGPRIQSISCQGALRLLEENPEAQLIDIRPKEDLRETGSPDLRTVKKSPINVAYKPRVEPAQAGSQQSTITIGWAERLCRNSKVGQELPVILLDTNGTAAGAAAKELAAAAPDRPVLYTISGGADAWLAQELPWKEPLRLGVNFDTLKSLDISGVAESTEKLVEKYKENPTLVNGGIAAVAVAGASAFLLTEVEAILQVVGVVFALQFLGKRLLFAEDRAQTFRDLKLLLTEKIAAGQAGDDLKRLAEKVLDAASAEEVTDRAAASAAAAPPPPPAAGDADSAAAWVAAWREKQQQADAAKEGDAGASEAGSSGAEEAQTWIEAWNAKQAAVENGAGAAEPENVAEARAWIEEYRGRQG